MIQLTLLTLILFSCAKEENLRMPDDLLEEQLSPQKKGKIVLCLRTEFSFISFYCFFDIREKSIWVGTPIKNICTNTICGDLKIRCLSIYKIILKKSFRIGYVLSSDYSVDVASLLVNWPIFPVLVVDNVHSDPDRMLKFILSFPSQK